MPIEHLQSDTAPQPFKWIQSATNENDGFYLHRFVFVCKRFREGIIKINSHLHSEKMLFKQCNDRKTKNEKQKYVCK